MVGATTVLVDFAEVDTTDDEEVDVTLADEEVEVLVEEDDIGVAE